MGPQTFTVLKIVFVRCLCGPLLKSGGTLYGRDVHGLSRTHGIYTNGGITLGTMFLYDFTTLIMSIFRGTRGLTIGVLGTPKIT